MESNKSYALPSFSDLLKYIPAKEKMEVLRIIDQAMSLTDKKVPKSKKSSLTLYPQIQEKRFLMNV